MVSQYLVEHLRSIMQKPCMAFLSGNSALLTKPFAEKHLTRPMLLCPALLSVYLRAMYECSTKLM